VRRRALDSLSPDRFGSRRAAAGALAAWRTWRAIRGGASAAGEVGERRRFMAIAGFLLAVYFSLAIVALAIPQIVHRPCD
jgi:hypothetical protein